MIRQLFPPRGLALLILLCAISPAMAQVEKAPQTNGMRTIAVVGAASIAVVPDIAEVSVRAETRGVTAHEVLEANNTSMRAMMNALKKSGVAERDIKTEGVNLRPVYDRPVIQGSLEERKPGEPAPKIIGYEIVNAVKVTVHDVSKVGEILDVIVKAGANQIRDLDFRVKDPRALLRDLRKKALADARDQAEEIAREAGMTLGLPLSIDLGNADGSPSNQYAFMARSNMIAKSDVPVSAGEQELGVVVQVVYEVKPSK